MSRSQFNLESEKDTKALSLAIRKKFTSEREIFNASGKSAGTIKYCPVSINLTDDGAIILHDDTVTEEAIKAVING